MEFDKNIKDSAYLVGRIIAVIERYASAHFGPLTKTKMFSMPLYYASAFTRYVDSEDPFWSELSCCLPDLPRSLNPSQQGTAQLGYYHQKAAYSSCTTYRERLGSELQTLRVQKGLTVRELGDACGLAFTTISKIENGKYNVSVDILGRVADALGYRLTFEEREGGR